MSLTLSATLVTGWGSAYAQSTAITETEIIDPQDIDPSDPDTGPAEEDALFGRTVATSDDAHIIVIGVPGSDIFDPGSVSTFENVGEVIVFEFDPTAGRWVEQSRFEGCESCFFGSAVALSGDGNTLVLGNRALGTVLIYERDGMDWTRVFSFTLSDTELGFSVAIRGSLVAVGEPSAPALFSLNRNAGRVWLFSRTGTASDPWEIYNPGGFPTWLRAADGRGEEAFGLANGDRFGESVAIDEKANTIVVGAPDETNPDDNACNTTNYQAQCEKGAAYVFELDLGTGQFVEQAKLVAPLLGDNGFDHLGTSVGVSGETIAVGTPNSHPFEDIYKLGSVLVFERVGDVWNQTASIDAPVVGLSGSGNPIEGFGFSVDLRGDVMLVGYGQEDPPPYPNPFCPLTVSGGGNCGAAYLFRRNGSTWVEDLKLIASEEAENNFVGTSVALAADAAVVGATPAQINAEVPVRRGRVYVYSFEPAPTFAVSFEDPDIPASGIDLEELTLLWGPDTGDYTLIWRASPAQPFIGNFRLNANLFNADAEASTSFFSDTFNDYSLVQPQTIIIENGSSAPQLTSWLDGDRIASACPEPLGCPPLVSVFWSGLLAGDVIEPQVQPVPEPTTAMGLVAGVAALALTLIPKLRDRSAPLR